ncbi:MAG: AMIN domain-containing protein [bacterium]|nr:AMIN domain-containing protein [bacterium]
MKHKHLNLFVKYIVSLLVITFLLSLIVGVNAEIKTKQRKATPIETSVQEYSLQEYSLKDIKIVENKDTIDIILENSHTPQYVTFPLSDTPRIVVNVVNATYNCPKNKIIVNKNHIICIRSSQFQLKPFKISRVVIDLDRKLKYQVSSKDNNIFLSFKKNDFLEPKEINSIDIKKNEDWVLAKITAFKDVQYKTFTLADPEKIVLDLKEATLNLKQKEVKIGKLNIDKVRLSQYQDKEEKIVRVVFDLTKKVPYKVKKTDNIIRILFGNINEEEVNEAEEEKVEVVQKFPKVAKEKIALPEAVKIKTSKEKEPISIESKITKKEETTSPEIGKKIDTKKVVEKEGEKVQIRGELKKKDKEIEAIEAKEEIKEATKKELFGEKIKKRIFRKSEVDSDDVLISMDFRNANIIDVLRIISYKTGVNIVPSKDVKGKITIKLDNVSWKNALSVLLQAYGYGYVEEGSIIRIDSKDKLLKETVVTNIFMLSYADAKMLSSSLKNMLTPGIGTINVDTRVNAVIITDNYKVIDGLRNIIKKLDTRTAQVLIEAKIVEVTLSDEERLGIQWNVKPLGLKENISGEAGVEFSTDNPGTKERGYVNIGTIQKGFNVNAQISALLQEGKLDVLSNPRIVVLNGQEAKIIAGEDIPYKTTTMGEGGTSSEQVSFREVGIKLVVTPTINPNGYITLKIHPEVSDVKEWKYEMPIISKRESDSLILVKDRETIVVGGLIKDKKITTKYGVPYLRKIPILGHLFKKKFIETKKTELLIFITPKIITYSKK